MHQIEIDDDVYRYLCRNTAEIGESANSILRRLLNLEGAPKSVSGGTPRKDSKPPFDRRPDECQAPPAELTEVLNLNEAVDRFLHVLSWLHTKHGAEFRRVLSVRGKRRTYFATSREEILRSGSSTQPRRIPGSEFWVITNNDTAKKMTILKDVLSLLGYAGNDVERIAALVDPAEDRRQVWERSIEKDCPVEEGGELRI